MTRAEVRREMATNAAIARVHGSKVVFCIKIVICELQMVVLDRQILNSKQFYILQTESSDYYFQTVE